MAHQEPQPDTTGEEPKSLVEISVGQSNIRIQGSEEFISKELSTVLDRVNLESQPPVNPQDAPSKSGTREDGHQPTENLSNGEGDTDDDESEVESEIAAVARKINVDPDDLATHFYIDDDGIHIQNPMKIEPRYALLGFCTIQEELEGITYHDYNAVKKHLIDKEKVSIEEWGSVFLHNLRQGGYIKDDPNSQKSRNIPFKITPSGREELVTWLNEDN